MYTARPLFSVCIPAYNRARHLPPLLDSIFSQTFDSYEVVICEDMSRERKDIAKIVAEYESVHPNRISYFENEVNLGFDANIRNLVQKANGKFCFFMGNDDIMCPGAIEHVAEIVTRHLNVGMVLKSYAWFDHVPEKINQEIRFFTEERLLPAGPPAIRVCFRRSGVISGYIIDRDLANSAATDKYDGTLYYQMHLTASVLATRSAVVTPRVLVLCRAGEPPEFGNSIKEKGRYIPGSYTPEARLRMIGGIITILRDLHSEQDIDVTDDVMRDYANYFYPYVRDQVKLPLRQYWALCKSYAAMGFGRYPLFYANCAMAYILGAERFDNITRLVRRHLGRSPQFGRSKR